MTILSVLIVDDEEGMRLGAERTLRDYLFKLERFEEEVSFKIQTVDNGTDALKIIDEGNIDILLLDHKLPDMQGLDILLKMREENKEVLSIMITAYASLDVAISATRSGAFDFLAKPFTPEELRNTVKKAAEHIYLNRKAHELEEEKRQVRFQFISVLAHELKSPLSAVENYLFLMRDKISGKSIDKYENMIERSLIRIDGMRKLIYDLLDLTRIESGQKLRNLSDLFIHEVVEEAVEDVALSAKDKNVTISVECDKSIVLNADKDEIKIILNNLLTNAVKYNKDNGSVNFKVIDNTDNIELVCADTGIGMSEEDVARLFNEFVRIKTEKTKNILGSGLGLSILKKIVDLYKGNIDVKSKLDVGTTISVTLKKIV